jgi:hypothetical protein
MTDQSTTDKTRDQEQRQILQLLRAPVPRLYANGFAIATSASDLTVALLLNGSPAGLLSLSYISAKSLIGELQTAVGAFEKAIGQEIQTINQVAEALEKNRGPGHAL